MPSSVEFIVLIGNYDDPIYHWFSDRLQSSDYQVGHWCLDDPATLDDDLSAPPADVVINTTFEKPSFILSSYLASAEVEGRVKPKLILQNVLCESLLQAQGSFSEKYLWAGFSPFSLYGYLASPSIPSIEITSLDPDALNLTQALLSDLNLPHLSVPTCPSLILGRIVAMLANEATSALMENIATPESIDTAMRLGTNYPMGPLAWADAAGLDVILAILNHLHDTYKEPRYRPMRLLQDYVALGYTGQKAGKGFFTYPEMAGTFKID